MTPRLKSLSLWLAPLAAVMVSLLMMQFGWAKEGAMAAGLTLLCALWWVFEPIPIPATSMIPLRCWVFSMENRWLRPMAIRLFCC